jgi:hypothetical protein
MKKNYVQLLIALLFATNVVAQNVPNYVPTNGLVGWWPFNGNANDESGNGNTLTNNNGSYIADRNGIKNSSIALTGSNSNLIKSNINPSFSNSNQTISYWFKLPLQFNYSTLSLINNGDQYSNGFSMFIDQNDGAYGINNYTVGYMISNGQAITFNTNQNELENWNNLISTYDGNILKIYLNNKLKASLNFNGIINSPNNDIIISNWSNASLPVNTSREIDDIGIWNRALTQEEITTLFKGCTKETATSTSFNTYVFTNNAPINLSATPIGGTFSGDGIVNNSFNPSKAKLGKNAIKYTFKNTSGCADSTDFSMIMVDTLGNVCKKTINDTVSILKIHFQLTTGIKANTVTNITVYPNPTSDVLIIDAIDSPALAGYTYRILDVQGKQIYNALVTSSKTEISLKTLGAKGVYVLHIVDANGISIENKKIVLQ